MLYGPKTTLRAPADDDLPRLVAWRNDIRLQSTLMSVPRANTADRVREWLARRLEDEHTAFFMIANSATAEAQGYIQLTKMHFIHGTAELGICVQPAAQGQGYGAEAVRLLENYAQQQFNLRKLTLKVLSDNGRAVSFYRRHGFHDVGTFRRHFFSGGEYRDVLLMEKFLSPEDRSP